MDEITKFLKLSVSDFKKLDNIISEIKKKSFDEGKYFVFSEIDKLKKCDMETNICNIDSDDDEPELIFKSDKAPDNKFETLTKEISIASHKPTTSRNQWNPRDSKYTRK